MKRTSLWASILVVSFLLIMITVNIGKADPTAVISVEPAKITGSVGETFTVDFIVTGVSNCYSWQVFCQYDDNIVNYTRWWEGPFLKGNPVLTLEDRALDDARYPYDQYEKVPTSATGDWSGGLMGLPAVVQTSNNKYATEETDGEAEIYGDFGFPDATMLAVALLEIEIESKWDGAGQDPDTERDEIYLQVSNDGGSTWGSTHVVQGPSSDLNRTIDIIGDFAWTPNMLSNTNFKVKTTYNKVGVNATKLYVDYLAVTAYDALLVDNPAKAHDGVLSSYASFRYGLVDGYFVVGNFTGDPVSTDSVIKKIDIQVKYSATASTGSDQYRIVYYVGKPTNPGTKVTLVDWTSASSSLQTHVWDDVEEPTDDEWKWGTDLKKLHIAFETDKVGGDSAATIDLYEARAIITYERPTTDVGFKLRKSSVNVGVSTIGSYPGVSGSGLLATVEFIINSEGDTTLDIQGGAIKLTYLLDPGAYTIPSIKEDGIFFEPWPEDVYPDGIIDIRDITIVGINYGTYASQMKNPSSSTGTWTTPEKAYISDNDYAYTASDGATQTYSGYGFSTTGWTSVTEVKVGIEVFQEADGEWVYVRVSGDGGSTWGVAHEVKPLGTSDPNTPTWIDVTGDLTWTPSMLTDTFFRVQIEYDKAGQAKKVFVDWLPVSVTPEPFAVNPEADVNGDGVVGIMDLAMVAIKYGEIYL